METQSGPVEVSIVLLVFNGEEYLEEVLEAIFSQQTKYTFEVIAIDSGSSDSSLQILQKFPVKLTTIPNCEFGHGKTRNLGVQLSIGEFLIFLTQDASPANDLWLENLVTTVASSEEVAGAYSRQLPRSDCNPCEKRDIEIGAPAISMIKRVNFKDSHQKAIYESDILPFIVFSNVSSCIKKQAALAIPFNTEINMMEDQSWCREAIEAGHTVMYDASSVVFHSHNFPLAKIYERNFDYGRSLREFTPFRRRLRGVVFHTLSQSASDVIYVWRGPNKLSSKLLWSGRSLLVRFAMLYGVYKGLKLKRPQ